MCRDMGEPEEKNSVVTAAIVATKKIRNPDKYYVSVIWNQFLSVLNF